MSAKSGIETCGLWASIIMVLLTLGGLTDPTLQTPVARAMIDMIWGLFLIWTVGAGLLMLRVKEGVRTLVPMIKLDSRVKFFIFATALSLLEEAITTGMTNLAPVFGAKIGQAYITASTDYLDVVLFHSVIVFLPMFLVWAFLISKYTFDPRMVLLLFGLTGTLLETFSFGPQNLIFAGLWVLVYGLMIYLPAYSFTTNTERKKPRLAHHLMAVLVPIAAAIPVALIVQVLFHHPTMEFQ